jgi:hypothetical protein
MDAKTDERTQAANPLASHHVRPDDMGWDTARFPGSPPSSGWSRAPCCPTTSTR